MAEKKKKEKKKSVFPTKESIKKAKESIKKAWEHEKKLAHEREEKRRARAEAAKKDASRPKSLKNIKTSQPTTKPKVSKARQAAQDFAHSLSEKYSDGGIKHGLTIDGKRVDVEGRAAAKKRTKSSMKKLAKKPSVKSTLPKAVAKADKTKTRKKRAKK